MPLKRILPAALISGTFGSLYWDVHNVQKNQRPKNPDVNNACSSLLGELGGRVRQKDIAKVGGEGDDRG